MYETVPKHVRNEVRIIIKSSMAIVSWDAIGLGNSPVQSIWFGNDPADASGMIPIGNWPHELSCQLWMMWLSARFNLNIPLGFPGPWLSPGTRWEGGLVRKKQIHAKSFAVLTQIDFLDSLDFGQSHFHLFHPAVLCSSPVFTLIARVFPFNFVHWLPTLPDFCLIWH
jgi:hypothetical protein